MYVNIILKLYTTLYVKKCEMIVVQYKTTCVKNVKRLDLCPVLCSDKSGKNGEAEKEWLFRIRFVPLM